MVYYCHQGKIVMTKEAIHVSENIQTDKFLFDFLLFPTRFFRSDGTGADDRDQHSDRGTEAGSEP